MDQPKKPQSATIFTRANEEGAGAASGFPLLLIIIAGGIIPGLIAYSLGTSQEAQVVAVVIGLLFMTLIFTRPFFGLIVYTGLIYTRPEENIAALAGMHLTLLIAIITFVGMGLQLLLEKKSLPRTPLITMMVGFTIMGIVSGVIRGVTVEAATDFCRLLAQVLLVLTLVRTPERYRSFVTVLIFFTSYLALYAAYLYFTGQVTVQTLPDGMVIIRSRATGIFEDPNDLAATMIPGVVLALSRIWQERGARKLVYLIPITAMGWAIWLTNSRGGMLGLMVAIGAFFLSFSKRKMLAVCMACVVGGAFLVVAPERMKNLDSQEQSANERLEYWHEGLIQLRAHPLTGVGYNGFQDVNQGHVAHNSFVNCFGELGFPGYFFWMGCIYFAFKRRPADTPDTEENAELAGQAETLPSPADVYNQQNASKFTTIHDLLGARVALLGFLAAAFWITRTYSPVMYFFFCLPITQQLSTETKPAPPLRQNDVGKILAFCIIMILLIYVFTLRR